MPENALRGWHLHQHVARSAAGAACPERERPGFDQTTPVGLRPAGMCCVRCGRMTARRDPDNGLPWCGGQPVTALQRTAEITPGTWATTMGPYADTDEGRDMKERDSRAT